MGNINFLLLAFIVIALPYVLSHIFNLRKIVPLVVIQIFVGIVLGPSLLGRVAPDFFAMHIDANATNTLSGIAAIAVLIFGFITGLHTDHAGFEQRGHSFIVVATASVLVPTCLGVIGGIFIGSRHPEAIGTTASLYAFAAGAGICVGVTALPVLAAVLRDMELLGGALANEALAIAAFNDAALWVLLGALLAHVGNDSAHAQIAVMLFGLAFYLVFMIKIVRPIFTRVVLPKLAVGKNDTVLVAACACAIGSAIITQAIGLHYIFGAFLAGLIMPRELKQPLLARLEVATVSVLMPFFFVLTGLRTFVDFSSPLFAEVFLITLALNIIGKIGGTTIASAMMGASWRYAGCLGTLVQTKGLMEIVVLTVLLEKGIISDASFSALTVMAIISTVIVMPITRLLLPSTRSSIALRTAE